MRITRGKTGSRRSHHGLDAPRLSRDSETDSTHKRHHVDLETGMYRGKKVFEPKVKEVKEEVVEEVEAQDVVAPVVEEAPDTSKEAPHVHEGDNVGSTQKPPRQSKKESA